MKRKPGSVKDLQVLKAAYLRSRDGGEREPKEIEGVLDIAQSTVSKYLATAKTKGYLKKTFLLTIPEGRKKEIESELLPYLEGLKEDLNQLAKKAGSEGLREIRVYHSGGDETEGAGYDARLKHFGHRAAERIEELIGQMRVAAVTWGRTLFYMIEGLRELDGKISQEVRFIPVGGELWHHPDVEIDSSNLVAQLQRTLAGESRKPDALGPVPAFIPASFTNGEVKVMRRFISHSIGYGKIFLDHESLIDRADTVLTSVGTASTSGSYTDLVLDEAATAAGMTVPQLGAITVGNIAGVFLHRLGLRRRELGRVSAINQRWTGIQLKHLERCAEKGRKSGKVGVVVLALGKEKRDIVLECVRRGLVNELIIDHDLAGELAKRRQE